ncbi:alpha/beta hydrolase [Aeromicrobium sp.]|uniref:alpha/beta hydrolase n=1 Tax=Aeromicrobium sp. TaxID=1871063 RepID=UPI002FC8B2DB
MSRRFIAAVLLTAALIAPAAPASADPSPANGHGLTVVATNVIDSRQTEYTVSTAALLKPVRIRVVLPSDYDPGTRYPVLYLYHGTSGRPSDWIGGGDALQTTAGKDLILVLPEAGYDGDGGGFFNDEWNGGKRGGSKWETFEYDQVIPWIDDNFPTIADRDHRAIAGLSQGGYGAAHGAALHPDMFTSVATFSGAPEIFRNFVVRAGASFIIEAITVGLNGNPPFTILGDPIVNAAHWQGHDPGTLVENFRGMDVSLWTATGIPGELDSFENSYGGGAGNVIEGLTHFSTLAFASSLKNAGIPRRIDNYVFGTHSFPYWAQDLREYLPILMDRFANPSTPTAISYSSTAKAYNQWNWGVAVHRSATEKLTTLKNASSAGFSFTGADAATVVTPPSYEPGSAHTVTIKQGAKTSTSSLTADASGRLTVAVPGTSVVNVG